MFFFNFDDIIQTIPSLDRYPDIKTAMDENKLAIFIGAGVSRLVGCKSWNDLANELLKKCQDLHLLSFHEFEVINGYTDQKKKISIAYGLLKENFEEEFFNIFDASLISTVPKKEKTIYDSINLLGDIFVTTNADECFDSKFIENDIVYDFKTTATVEPHKLYHIHGSKKVRASLVFTAEQYLKRYNNRDINNQEIHFQEFLCDLFSKYTVLFIGYGLTEFELLDYLTLKAKTIDNKKKHYALMPYYSFENSIMKHDRLYYNSLNIEIIPYAKDDNGYNQLIEIVNDWTNKSNYLNLIDTELEDIFTKADLDEKDIQRIVEIILRDDSLLNSFIKLCNKKPEFTPKLIEVIYANNFFNPQNNCDYWQILEFLKIYVKYCNDSGETKGLDTFEKILLENLTPVEKRIKNPRSDNTFMEIIFNLDENYIREEYIRFIEDSFNTVDTFLSSYTLAFSGIPKILTYKNLDFVKRIINVLFSYHLVNTNFPYIFSKSDVSFLKNSVIKNLDKMKVVLKDDLLNIVFNILCSIPKEYRLIVPKNYGGKEPIFEDYYVQTLFNLVLFLIKDSPNVNQSLNKMQSVSKDLASKIELTLQQTEIQYTRSHEDISDYNIPTQSEDEIKSMTSSDILKIIKNNKNSGLMERSQSNSLIHDWFENYAEICSKTLDAFIDVEPYFLNSFFSALNTLIRKKDENRLSNIQDIFDFANKILPEILKLQDEENEIGRDSSFVIRNICSFISDYIKVCMQKIEFAVFLQMKNIVILIYKNLTDKRLTASNVYTYNSDLLNSRSGNCFDALFYLYAFTKEKLKKDDTEINDILTTECQYPTSSTFITMLGKNIAYFFYYEKQWCSDILLSIMEKDVNIQKAFWSGYFYSPYNTSKDLFDFLIEKRLYYKLFSLGITDSEHYQKMADICTSAYLQGFDDITNEKSILKLYLDSKDLKFIDALINSFILRKKAIDTKYEDKIVSIWGTIVGILKTLSDNQEITNIKIQLLQFVEVVSKIDQEILELIDFSTIEISYYRVDHFFVSALLNIYSNDDSSKENIETIILNFTNTGTFFSDYDNKFSELFKLIMGNNKEVALQIANIYKRHNESKYLNILSGRQK